MEPVESVHHEVTDGWIPWMDVSYGHWTLVVVEPMPYIHTYRWLIYIYIYICMDLWVFNDISYPMGIRCSPKFPDKGETGGFF